MDEVYSKTEVGPLNGTPDKRLFWSIISDYDLKTGLCELVDNALDMWRSTGKKRPLKIEISLDVIRQLISVKDNAGGVKQSELHLLLSPGGSRNDPGAEIIGIFGVGSKRAGVALGEEVRIRTRFRNEQTYEIDIPKEWLESPSWEMVYYRVPSITNGTTIVEISHLRKPFDDSDVQNIKEHLSEAYGWFLENGCQILLGPTEIKARSFKSWSYPSKFLPREVAFNADFKSDGKLSVLVTGGLIADRDPEKENYGVYFYCNNRLIVKELKSREVGYFVTSEAGVPHPDSSLCRVIVELSGPAKLMPWNSSKSGINFGNPAFQALRPLVIQLTSHYSSLSRRLKHDWGAQVFKHKRGKIQHVELDAIPIKNPLILPPLPKVNKPRVEQLKAKNKIQIQAQPWTLGLVEAMGAVEVIGRQHLETKNRIALILLDSNFEIALKEFIVHRTDLFPASQFNAAEIQKLFSKRHLVIGELIKKVSIPQPLLDKAQHYYGMRNKLIHERATMDVIDFDIDNYRSVIEKILTLLFKLKF